MSYIRCGYPLTYVEGNSEDYVFSDGKRIVDYGFLADTGIVEMLFENWETKDVMFKDYLLRRLADRLDVKLRKKPLTDKQWEKLQEINMKKFDKERKAKNEI